ncbi:MAG: hypothetical protein HC903_10085 [Methylacidiphilales bacterium]|nr:hypothetical protein [Candidatus Methylacidiphilales bacterium]
MPDTTSRETPPGRRLRSFSLNRKVVRKCGYSYHLFNALISITKNRATHVINESIAIYGLYYCELQIRSLLTAIAGITKLI